MTKKKTAVILFNLGGPDSIEAIKPFLFNLFYDPAIIRIPNPFRFLVAKLISSRREKTAQEIYKILGGRSPLLKYTEEQASALEKQLGSLFKVFPVMRYWHPRADDVAKQVLVYGPDQLVLLPLYPQYSTTTTASSLKDWYRAAKNVGLTVPTSDVCCYFQQENFIKAHVDLLQNTLKQAKQEKLRILFSAHGLPQKFIEEGDPYAYQVKETVSAIMKYFPEKTDWRICYQSRVGSMKWLEPSTELELKNAAADGVGVVVSPIAFVSEHSETLVELDLEYKDLSQKLGVKEYLRVPALNRHALYIEALAELTQSAINGTQFTNICPTCFVGCRNHRDAMAA